MYTLKRDVTGSDYHLLEKSQAKIQLDSQACLSSGLKLPTLQIFVMGVQFHGCVI